MAVTLVVCPGDFKQKPLKSTFSIIWLTVKPKHSLDGEVANSCLLMPVLFGRIWSQLAARERELIDGSLIVSLVSSRCSITDARNKLDFMKEKYNL